MSTGVSYWTYKTFNSQNKYTKRYVVYTFAWWWDGKNYNSSMTDEQEKEFVATLEYLPSEAQNIWTLKTYEWCDKNHFDYRGLIPMGLAIDATAKNIY